MGKRKILEAIRFFKRCLEEGGVRVSRIVLFGSQAKGTSTLESDVDIVIVSEDFRNKDIFERAELVTVAEVKTMKRYMIPFDIIMKTPEELKSKTSLIAAYAREGEVVYGR